SLVRFHHRPLVTDGRRSCSGRRPAQVERSASRARCGVASLGTSVEALTASRAPCAGAFCLRATLLRSASPMQRERRDMADKSPASAASGGKPVRTDKATTVAELTDQFRSSAATVLTEY